ncbi:MAG: baseplate protein J [Cyanobacteria bacterium P01_A01_bin.84]
MPLPLPNLDDHTYADLVESAISQISVEYPEWTDYNPSDTGIILIELLAWLSEMTLYRVNQIGDENYASFLSLLKGEQWNLANIPAKERQQSLQSEINKTLLELRQRYRAVTTVDYEQLIIEDWNTLSDSTLKIVRVKCLSQRNLSEFNIETVAKGNISLIVVPEQNIQENNNNNKYEKLLDFLNERKLLTTRLHIVEALYVSVAITAEIVVEDGIKAEEIKENAENEVNWFFHPLHSGKYWGGKGWPFARGIYLSELYKILDDLEGVDYVENLLVNNSDSDIDLADNQLVSLDIKNSQFTILVEFDNDQKPI